MATRSTAARRRALTAGLENGRRCDHVALLERIDATGSINAAARALGISYRAAWAAVEQASRTAVLPLVARQAGGARGGGTALTPYGRRIVAAFRAIEGERARLLAALDAAGGDFDASYRATRRFELKTSARNQFRGTVTRVVHGAVNAEVALDIGGAEIVAVVTENSVEHLGLAPGVEAWALVKAPWVVLVAGDGPRTSARNDLAGTVVQCTRGAVNAEVLLELPGGRTIAAIVTNESVDHLGLAVGAAARALIKASHVILAVGE